jgi:hypothetical protein
MSIFFYRVLRKGHDNKVITEQKLKIMNKQPEYLGKKIQERRIIKYKVLRQGHLAPLRKSQEDRYLEWKEKSRDLYNCSRKIGQALF